MKVSFEDVASRLTGVSCPFFGVSWEPPESERKIAQDIITHLEDHRALYNPYHLEVVSEVVRSVERMREVFTDTLKRLGDGSEQFVDCVRAMRRSCRKFLDQIQHVPPSERELFNDLGMGLQMLVCTALGELRHAIGIHIGQISVMYGLDVEEELARLLPEPTED